MMTSIYNNDATNNLNYSSYSTASQQQQLRQRQQLMQAKQVDPIQSTAAKRIIQTVFDIIIFLFIIVAYILVYFLVSPTISYLTCDDTSIIYPYKTDTIPFWAVCLYSIGGPILFIIIVELKNSLSTTNSKNSSSLLRQFLICTFHALSLFALGASITLLLTEIGKRWIGRLRPNFLSICKPNLNLINCTSVNCVTNGFLFNPIYTGGNFCTSNSTTDLTDARLSFPSGHASFSTYTMLFLIIYIEARLLLLTFRYFKVLIQMTAFITALITCITRIIDFRHRPSDVIGGVLLGSTIAFFITLVVGRVLWEYKRDRPVYDYDMKYANYFYTYNDMSYNYNSGSQGLNYNINNNNNFQNFQDNSQSYRF